MATHQVRVLRSAQRNLDEIRKYLDSQAPESVERVMQHLLDAIDSLDNTPSRGALPREERLRNRKLRYLVAAPYLIFYRVLKTKVWIYGVIHAKRDYGAWL